MSGYLASVKVLKVPSRYPLQLPPRRDPDTMAGAIPLNGLMRVMSMYGVDVGEMGWGGFFV